jgi:pimeloyl-ACP methyl ester carboxylesterase
VKPLGVVLGAAALLLFGAGMRSWIVDRMLFYPTPGVDLAPERLGLQAEEVFLTTEDDVRIHGFYLPAPGASRALLFLHGNAGNASHRLPNAALLARSGTDVLLLDYRGYGRSEGRPNERGVYADARAGLRHLVEERGFPERRVVLFGRSLGGAVAVDLAQDRPLAGVILESTWSSLADAASSVFGPLAVPFARGFFDSSRKIARARSPLLFFHGDRDEIVPYDLGRRLFESAPEPKTFETLHGAGHNDTVEVGGRPYIERLHAFLEEVAPRPGARPGATTTHPRGGGR